MSRSPYGERGLKYRGLSNRRTLLLSLSLRRAWIEIFTTEQLEKTATVALLTESVD